MKKELNYEKLQALTSRMLKCTLCGVCINITLHDIRLLGGTNNWMVYQPILMEQNKNEDITNESLLEAANQNDDLNSEIEIKKVITGELGEYISQNPYFDYELAYTRLQKLDVVENYVSNAIDKLYTNNKVSAYYMLNNNTLHLIDEYNRQRPHIIFHELVHAISYDDPETNYNSKFFVEGMTQLLTDEYTNNVYYDTASIMKDYDSFSDTIYQNYVAVCKILCELLGEDLVLEAFSMNQYHLIESELESIVGSKATKEIFWCINQLDNIPKKDLYGDEYENLAITLIAHFKQAYELKYQLSGDENDILNEYYKVILLPEYYNSKAIKFYYNDNLKEIYPQSYIVKEKVEEFKSYQYEVEPYTNNNLIVGEDYTGYVQQKTFYFELANDPILNKQEKSKSLK